MKPQILTEEQCYNLASYLRTAAGQFDVFAQQISDCRIEGLVGQFEKQAREARRMANLFEAATVAEVTLAPEVTPEDL